MGGEGEKYNKSKNKTKNEEGKEENRETKVFGKATMAKRYLSKVEMEEVTEMARRQKETFDPDECNGKAGDTHTFEKYLYIAT